MSLENRKMESLENVEQANNNENFENALNKEEGKEVLSSEAFTENNKRNLDEQIDDVNSCVSEAEKYGLEDKKFEDYSYTELKEMIKEDPEKVKQLNMDFQERYEADTRGMTVDEYRDYKNLLNSEIEEQKETSKKVINPEEKKEKFDNISNQIQEFRNEYWNDNNSEFNDKKRLGKNLNTMSDIYDMRRDINQEMKDCYEKMASLRQENPDLDANTHEEYKNTAKRYYQLEDMDNQLKSWEAELDGKNYAICENRGLPYYQQTEHFDDSNKNKLEKMNTYLNGSENNVGLKDRLTENNTTPLDKFQFEFQYNRMNDTLDNIKENGTAREKEYAEKLTTDLENMKAQFDELHTEYELKDDGTVVEKSETHTNAKTIYSSGEQVRHLENGGTVKSSTDIGLGGKHITKELETLLYTNESTGKVNKTVTRDGFHIRNEREEKGINKDGTEYSKKDNSEFSLLRSEVNLDMDLRNGKIDTKMDAVGAKFYTESEKQDGDKKTHSIVEANIGHANAEVSANVNEGEYSANANANAADAKFEYKYKNHDKSFEIGGEAKLYSNSIEANFGKTGLQIDGESRQGRMNGNFNVNGNEKIEYKYEGMKLGDYSYDSLEEHRNVVEYVEDKIEEIKEFKSYFEELERIKEDEGRKTRE